MSRDAFGHLALGVGDIYKTCDELRNKGAKIVREPGPHDARRNRNHVH